LCTSQWIAAAGGTWGRRFRKVDAEKKAGRKRKTKEQGEIDVPLENWKLQIRGLGTGQRYLFGKKDFLKSHYERNREQKA